MGDPGKVILLALMSSLGTLWNDVTMARAERTRWDKVPKNTEVKGFRLMARYLGVSLYPASMMERA